jgi:hypothetical protein
MNKIQRVEQQQLWMSRINDLASSGLTQSQWCQEKGFSVDSWRERACEYPERSHGRGFFYELRLK